MARKKTTSSGGTAGTRKGAEAAAGPAAAAVRVYTVKVLLVRGPVTQRFARRNPEMSRTIEVRGDQTLQVLHHAIFDAFDREDEHLYEFQFGERPMDPKNRCYVLSESMDDARPGGKPPAGLVDQTSLDALGLKVGDHFGYWFDFGDDWWHQIDVEGVEERPPGGKYPRVTKKVGKSPPQYADLDEDA